MKKTVNVILIMVIILLAGLLGAVLVKPPQKTKDPEDLRRTFEKDRDTWESFLRVKSAITMINIVISILLIAIYIGIYRDVKSDFTLGLLIVMFTLLLYALTSNPLFHYMFGYGVYGAGPFTIIPDLFTTLALSVLLLHPESLHRCVGRAGCQGRGLGVL